MIFISCGKTCFSCRALGFEIRKTTRFITIIIDFLLHNSTDLKARARRQGEEQEKSCFTNQNVSSFVCLSGSLFIYFKCARWLQLIRFSWVCSSSKWYELGTRMSRPSWSWSAGKEDHDCRMYNAIRCLVVSYKGSSFELLHLYLNMCTCLNLLAPAAERFEKKSEF